MDTKPRCTAEPASPPLPSKQTSPQLVESEAPVVVGVVVVALAAAAVAAVATAAVDVAATGE